MDINENSHYVLNPWININESKGSYFVTDKLNGNEFQIPLTLLDSAIISINKNDYNQKDVLFLISLFVIINKQLVYLFENPILDKSNRIKGKEIKLHELSKHVNINVIIGVPYDFSQTVSRSAHYGPFAIRKVVQSNSIQLRELYDLGDISFFIQEGLEAFNDKLKFILQNIINSSNVPILLGGDHSITYWVAKSLNEMFKEKIDYFIFDAHLDSYGNDQNIKRLNNANFIYHLSKLSVTSTIYQLGIRKKEFKKKNLLNEIGEILKFNYKNSTVNNSKKNCYVSIDMDYFDSSICKNVTHPESNGYQLEDFFNHLDTIKKNYKIVGIDIMEIWGNGKEINDSAILASSIISKINSYAFQ